MTKEGKKIINKAVKENWRMGDRSRLKRLLKKNLKLYRENVELERKLERTEKDLADLKEKYNRVDIIGYDALKNLTEAKEIIKEFVCHYNNKTIYVNNVKPLLEQAEQFLQENK